MQSVILTLAVRSEALLWDAECPFPEKRLHPRLAGQLREEAAGAAKNEDFEVRFVIHDGVLPEASDVGKALRRSFEDEVESATAELRIHFREARKIAVIALFLSALLMGVSELLLAEAGRTILDALGRGLLVLAWVVLWHPAELFIYEHLPIRRRRRLAGRLAKARVSISRS